VIAVRDSVRSARHYLQMAMPALTDADEPMARLARTRRGPHRDKALAAYRRARALELRASGMGYEQIASELGYANKGTVHRIVSEALRARQDEGVDVLRKLEMDRLETLLATLWPRAMDGDLDAVPGLLRIIESQCRLLGLYGAGKSTLMTKGWDNCQGPRTVVIRPDDCRHVGCIRHGGFDS